MHHGRRRRGGVTKPRGHTGNGLVESDPHPAALLREALARQRELGNGFLWAWGTASIVMERQAGSEARDWFAAFHGTRAEWESAYKQLPVERPLPVDLLSRFGEPAESWSVQQQGSRC